MKIAVIGSGIMGNGIAQVMATGGHDVILNDIRDEALEKSKKEIQRSLEKISKKQPSLVIDDILNRITFTVDKNSVKDCDVVIEAIIENLEAKQHLFKQLDELCEEHTILASNTSSFSIGEIASFTNRKDRVCGLHFFNPVPVMNLVEISATEETSEETIEKVQKLISTINKESIRVKDKPLFVVNRLLVPLICEAIELVDEKTASVEDIDKGMKLGANHPIGPLALADLIGLDTLLYIQEALYEKTDNEKYAVPPLLSKMVKEGKLGRKSGEGFYKYA